MVRSYILQVRRSASLSVLVIGMLGVWTPPAWSHAGNTDPTAVHACVGTITKVVRIVGVSGQCLASPARRAETPVHWPGVAPTPAMSPLHYIDSTGKLVGLAFSDQQAVVDIGNGTLLVLVIGRSGFPPVNSFFPERRYFESGDCTGPGFVLAPSAFLYVRPDSVVGSMVTYPDVAAAAPRAIKSATCPLPGSPGCPLSGCQAAGHPELPTPVAPPLTFDLSTLGLVPPFTLVQ